MFDGPAPCTVYGILNDMGYLISCESDMRCLMTMVMLKLARLVEGKGVHIVYDLRAPLKIHVM